jgi:predicted nucleotidyltransferase
MITGSADKVVDDTVEAARAVFGDEIEAVYALGSLAHGGFAPLVSDVDVAIVLASTGPETADRIAEVQSMVSAKASSPLAERLSLFWGDWRAVRKGEGESFRLGPVDRLDLLDSGRLLLGSDLREPSVRPTQHQLLLMSADFILAKFSTEYLEGLGDTGALLTGGERAVTKAILFPVRFMYSLREGGIGLNDRSALWYGGEGLPGGPLALKALDWRGEGIGDVDLAARMLDAELGGLHVECLNEYAAELDRLGEAGRAATLATRVAAVHIAVGADAER